jgi:hypothetical protein
LIQSTGRVYWQDGRDHSQTQSRPWAAPTRI